MANSNYLVNTIDLTPIANAIREKGGTTELLTFPGEFVTAIQDIPTGGGTKVELSTVVSTAPAETLNFHFSFNPKRVIFWSLSPKDIQATLKNQNIYSSLYFAVCPRLDNENPSVDIGGNITNIDSFIYGSAINLYKFRDYNRGLTLTTQDATGYNVSITSQLDTSTSLKRFGGSETAPIPYYMLAVGE